MGSHRSLCVLINHCLNYLPRFCLQPARSTSLRPHLVMWSEPRETILLVELRVLWAEDVDAARKETWWKGAGALLVLSCWLGLGFAQKAQKQGVRKPPKNWWRRQRGAASGCGQEESAGVGGQVTPRSGVCEPHCQSGLAVLAAFAPACHLWI